MKQLAAMRGLQDDLAASEKDNTSLRSKMSIMKLKLRKAKAERDRAAEQALLSARERVALDRLIRVNTIVTSGSAIIDGPDPKSRMELVRQNGENLHSAPGDNEMHRESSHYRGNHPGASKFMQCTREVQAGDGMLECQRGDIVYINYGYKDATPDGMVNAVSYNGKRWGNVPVDCLVPAASNVDLARGFDPQHLHGHLSMHSAGGDFDVYSPSGDKISPARGVDFSRLGTATVARLGASPAYPGSRPTSSGSGQSGGLTRERVNQTVTYHTQSEQARREQVAASPVKKKSGICC